MTAFLSLPYSDRVEILTDGATCFPSGRLLAKTNKVAASPHIPLAVTGRGNHGDLRRITAAIMDASECGSFDGTITAVVELLEAGKFRERTSEFEVVLAGMSETAGPQQFIFKSGQWPVSPFGPVAPFTVVNWGAAPLVGSVELTEYDLAEAGITVASFAAGLADVGIPLFEAMRQRSRGDTPETEHAFWIGAHVDHTVIDADGVRTTRIHEWPDKHFEFIAPASALDQVGHFDFTGIAIDHPQIITRPDGTMVVSDDD